MPRRSNGEGTEITKGADGRWHASLSFGTKAGGRRERRHVSGASRKEVAAKLRALQAKHVAGIVPVADGGLTVTQWLRHWLETIAATRVRPGTLYDYRLMIESRVIPALGHHRLNRLQPEHVEAFYRACMRPQVRKDPATGQQHDVPALSANSVVKIHRVLSRALRVAVHRKRVARNVCTLVDPPTVIKTEVEPLTAGEARRILHEAARRRNAARWSVALALGMRQGEALGLLWTDVDLATGTLTVRRTLETPRLGTRLPRHRNLRSTPGTLPRPQRRRLVPVRTQVPRRAPHHRAPPAARRRPARAEDHAGP